MNDKEAVYDEKVAPLVMEAGKICEAEGLSMSCIVEYRPGATGCTSIIQPGSGAGVRIADLAARAHGNVDSLFVAVQKYGREHGHNSIYLTILERKETPDD